MHVRSIIRVQFDDKGRDWTMMRMGPIMNGKGIDGSQECM